MVPKTRLTQEYQLEIPFVNAGMAFVATAPLATAVCNAGGLGMIGIAAMSPPVLRAQIDDIRRATSRPFGVNIIARFSTPEQIDVLVEGRVPVVVFFWDEAPADWIARLRAAGSKIWFEIGSVAEARAAMARGAEAFVVQGVEASGHNRSSAGRCHSCRRFAPPPPDGRTAAAALALGADGVWVGTRLLASHEADAHPGYKQRVLAAEVDGTVRNNIFGPEFPVEHVRMTPCKACRQRCWPCSWKVGPRLPPWQGWRVARQAGQAGTSAGLPADRESINSCCIWIFTSLIALKAYIANLTIGLLTECLRIASSRSC